MNLATILRRYHVYVSILKKKPILIKCTQINLADIDRTDVIKSEKE